MKRWIRLRLPTTEAVAVKQETLQGGERPPKRQARRTAKQTEHEACAANGLVQFAYFNLGGVVFFASGYLVFVLLYGFLHWHWLLAKGIADLVGWSLNYLIQHYVAFSASARQQGHKVILKKFVPFSLINIPIDYAIVAGLRWFGVTPFIGLWVSSLFFTAWKWLWYKHWVFSR